MSFAVKKRSLIAKILIVYGFKKFIFFIFCLTLPKQINYRNGRD